MELPSLEIKPAFEVAEPPDVALGTCVVSVQPSGFRRLHCIGSCSRYLGIDSSTFEVLGTVDPPIEAFTKRCKQCFREASVPQTALRRMARRCPEPAFVHSTLLKRPVAL